MILNFRFKISVKIDLQVVQEFRAPEPFSRIWNAFHVEFKTKFKTWTTQTLYGMVTVEAIGIICTYDTSLAPTS